MTQSKVADPAGPGISTYEEVEKILPRTYRALLPPMERMQAVFAAKSYIEEILDRYPALPYKERENRMLKEVAPAFLIVGIGWPLEDDLKLPYHQAILNDEIPLSIGGGIGQSRTYMYLLRTAHLGEVRVTVWPKALGEICAEHNIHVLE